MEAAFNNERTLDALSKMQTHQQLAFGAACCERMLPNYEMFMREENWGDIEPLRCALDAVWDACRGTRPREARLRDLLSQCESCAPNSEDFASLYTSAAQDVTFSICALLEFLLDGDVGHIVSVPRFSTDSIDLIVQEREEMDPRDPLREQKILEHPLMQQELVRQRRDFADAINVSPGDKVALFSLRARAQLESNVTLAP